MLVQQRLREMAEMKPGEPALISETRTLSWHGLSDQVIGAELALRAHGLCQGDRIALDLPNPQDTLVWFLAADACGLSTLIVEPSWTDPERAHILEILNPQFVLTQPLPAPSGRGTTTVHNGATSRSDDELFYIGTTSGSSAEPKLYTRTRESWRVSFAALSKVFDPNSTDLMLVSGSLSSSLFLFSALHALHSSSAVIVSSPWSADKAVIHCRRATAMHLVPAMLAALCDRWEADPQERAACQLRVILSCGAKLSHKIEDRLRKLLPKCRLIEYYGSSEHSLVAIRQDEAQNTVGKCIPEVDLSIRDSDGQEVPPHQEGQVWVRSPLMFEGYLTARGLDRSVFDPHGWLSNGDRGVLSPQGTLEIRARAGQSVITSGGHQVSTAEVESILRELPQVREVVVLGTHHERLGLVITAVIEPHPDSTLKLTDLRAQVSQYLAPAKRPRKWWSAESLPRTASGKVVRVVDTVMSAKLAPIR